MAIQKPRKSSSTAFKRLPRRVVNSSVQLSSFEAADLLDFTTLVAAIDYSKVANSTYDTLKTWAGTISRSLVDTVVTHKEPRVQALGRQASRRAIRMRQCFELEHVIRNYDLDFLAAQSYLEEYKRMEQELRPFEDKHFDKEWSLHRRIIKAAKAIGEVLAAQGLDKDLLNTATASSTTRNRIGPKRGQWSRKTVIECFDLRYLATSCVARLTNDDFKEQYTFNIVKRAASDPTLIKDWRAAQDDYAKKGSYGLEAKGPFQRFMSTFRRNRIQSGGKLHECKMRKDAMEFLDKLFKLMNAVDDEAPARRAMTRKVQVKRLK